MEKILNEQERDVLGLLVVNELWYDGCEWGENDETKDVLGTLAWKGIVSLNDLGVFYLNDNQLSWACKNLESNIIPITTFFTESQQHVTN